MVVRDAVAARLNPILPTDAEALLLRAALDEPGAACLSFARWQATGQEGDRRLLPLVYRNLRSHLEDADGRSMLKMEYLRTGSATTVLFHYLRALLRLLGDAGVPTLLLKGSALALAYARDVAARPMNDIDILVPTARATEAIALLEAAGWLPMARGFERFTEPYVGIAHSHPFRKQESCECDLHWHVLPECCRPDDDEAFWEAAQALDVGGLGTRVLGPADQVLHTCVHGARWNQRRSVQWLADVMMVLRSGRAIDWPRLVAQTRQRRLSLRVYQTLGYLAQHFDAPIPAEVLQELGDVPVSRMDRWEYEYQLADHGRHPLGYIPILWFLHRRWRGHPTFFRQVLGFPDYLRRYWGGEGVRELIGHVSTAVSDSLPGRADAKSTTRR